MKQQGSGTLDSTVKWDILWGSPMSIIVDYQDYKYLM